MADRVDNTVPVIDISPYLAGHPEGMSRVAGQLDLACRQSGFFQIIGHGVEETLVKSVYDVVRDFFDLPVAEKCKVEQPAPDQVRGWSGVGKEGLSYSLDAAAPGDLKEKIDVGPPDVPGGVTPTTPPPRLVRISRRLLGQSVPPVSSHCAKTTIAPWPN